MFDSDPSVWVNDLFGVTEYPGLSVLCLRGFDPSAPINVVVTAGDFRARTEVRPVVGSPEMETPLGYEEEPSTTLFEDGAELKVYTQGYGSDRVDGPDGSMVSEMWKFVPPLPAREAIASDGSFTIKARQSKLEASLEQPVAIPRTRSAFLLSSPVKGNDQLVVLGYPKQADVPIGLYRRTDDTAERAELVKQIGSVTMPTSQVAEFGLSSQFLESLSPGYYCLLPPAVDTKDCPKLHIWPEYPGRASPGDEGKRVEAWQEILIDAGVMSDISANRDGVYGPATAAALERWLENRGWTNPDGDSLGRALYNEITRTT